MQIKRVILLAQEQLHTSASSFLDAEILMCHVLKITRSKLITKLYDEINHLQKMKFLALIDRRAQSEPISKIIGKKDFWKSTFITNQYTLDPRPDTEFIIEGILKLIPNKNRYFTFADLGTGTGCILISILMEYPYARGIGFEKSIQAYRVARANVTNHQLNSRVQLFASSWTRMHHNADIIISNPPYISGHEMLALSLDVHAYDPHVALKGGVSGMQSYISIFEITRRNLNNNGYLILELGNLKTVLRYSHGFTLIRIIKDIQNIERCAIFQLNCRDNQK